MQYEIKGTVMPMLEVRLGQGEAIYTESGGMAWMSEGIAMETSGRGGLGKMLGRALAGESLFLTTYTCQASQATIVFTPEAPGAIIPVPLQAGFSIIAQKDAFMCAEDSVTLEMHFRKRLGTGLFGGEGFILQKLTGPGTAFVEIAGEVQSVSAWRGPEDDGRSRPHRHVRADGRLRRPDGARGDQRAVRRRGAVPGDPDRAGPGVAPDDAAGESGRGDQALHSQFRLAH